MGRWLIAGGLAIALADCGGGGVTTPQVPAAVVISGTIVDTQQRQPIPGATVVFGTGTVTADTGGAFSTTLPAALSTAVRLVAPGHMTRETYLRTDASRSGVAVDMIDEASPFSLTFFREFARNGAEGSSLQTLRPWTVAPSFYIKTTDDIHQEVPVEWIEGLKTILVNSVPELTGGRLSVAMIETGDSVRAARDGWVTVEFQRELFDPMAAGAATIGGNRGTMSIRSTEIPGKWHWTSPAGPAVVAIHEIVHTMGFWHTNTPAAFGAKPDGSGRPEITRYHATIAYSRPPGNMDPDVDPGSHALALSPGPVIFCP